MAVLVDPPQGDDSNRRPAASAPPAPGKLAEPPIPGGRVEELMGRLIRVLSHSPFARPLPAVLLSALGLALAVFVGLCATAPVSAAATPPVLLPLTALARRLGTPHLPTPVTWVIMWLSIGLCSLGLGLMLWANSRGWNPSPKKVFAAMTAVIAVIVNITPVGSADVASYAAYGRIAALGHNPYTYTPLDLPGGAQNAYSLIVSPTWLNTPSVYGPVATWMNWLAAEIGGPRAWVTIWVLMIMAGVAFLATGYVLMRTAANPVRATLLWVANPLMILEIVMAGHLDATLALVAIIAVVMSRRRPTVVNDIGVGLLLGVAGAIKINAGFVALGIAIQFLHDRSWWRLVRVAVAGAVTVSALYLLTWGVSALGPLSTASKQVISPTVWSLVEYIVQHTSGLQAAKTTTDIFGFVWPLLLLALAWYLYNRLSPDVPRVVAGATALTFAWVIVAPWSLPWYLATAWVTLALLPRNTLTRWLTIVTGGLALFHFNGGFQHNTTVGPTP